MKQRLEELQQQVDSQEKEGPRRQKKGHGSSNSGRAAASHPAHEPITNGTTDSTEDSSIDAPHTSEDNVEGIHLHLGGTNADASLAKPATVLAGPLHLPSEKYLGQPLPVDRDGFSPPQFANISLPNSPPFPSHPPRQAKRGPAPGPEPIPYPYMLPTYACPSLRMQAELMQDCFMQDCFMQYHPGPVSRIMESDPSINDRDLSSQKVMTGKFRHHARAFGFPAPELTD